LDLLRGKGQDPSDGPIDGNTAEKKNLEPSRLVLWTESGIQARLKSGQAGGGLWLNLCGGKFGEILFFEKKKSNSIQKSVSQKNKVA